MLNKIDKEINDFTNSIKEVKGCDDMLTYMNSNIYASVKLIMFASTTFSLYAKVMLFFIIALTGLLISSSIGANAISSTLLLGTVLFLFALLIIYISNYKKLFILSIENKKNAMQQDEQ